MPAPRDNSATPDTLGHLARIAPVRFPEGSLAGNDPVEVLARCVGDRRLDRVSARAAWLLCEGKLDPRDLRQLIPAGIGVGSRRHAQPVVGEGPPTPTRGAAVGRYTLGRQLGVGGSGRVFLSRHPALGVRVAVKVVTDATRAVAEVDALTAVCHPNVIRLWDTGRSEYGRHLILGYAAGGSVLSLLRAGRPVSPRVAFRAARHALRGLAAARAAGFTHGDVKPANILRQDRTFVLADFGLAERVGGGGPVERVYGSWAYLAPERFDGHGDHRADLYSLALTLYHLLAGVPPVAADTFAAASRAHHTLKLEPLHWTVPGVSREQSAVLRQMAARDPATRPAEFTDLIAVFRGGNDRARQSE
jgi:serine/threonine-protein kinase